VRSARFADDAGYRIGTSESIDSRNNALLLEQLQHAATTDRNARFVCTLALAREGEVLLRAEGFVAGEVLDAPRGENGFGYDPLFLLPSLGLTAAELPPAQKWEISHRGNAFRELLKQIAVCNL
jgi:XTP/dITP diphosphohydrolase